MVHTFNIALDSPTGSYYAGTNVTGRVLLTLDKPKNCRGLKIKFEGKAYVSWSGTETVRKNDGGTEQETITYSADEQYFSNCYFLVGSSNGEIEIPAGEHVYPFTTTLPPQLPTSFEGEHGHVRYTVVATVDRPWKKDYEAKTIFQVVTPLDLNYHALSKEPVKKEEFKTFCCCCCKSGPLTLVACLPHTGYVPGQDILVTIEADNASNEAVESIQIKIKKILKWTVRMPKFDTKVDNIELSKMTLEGVEVNGSKTLQQNIVIPQMPFVNLDACSIIDVSFVLRVTAQVSGMCSKNLSLEIPLVLGTVPLHNTMRSSPMAPPPTMGIMPSGNNTNFGQPPPGYYNNQAGPPPPAVGFNSGAGGEPYAGGVVPPLGGGPAAGQDQFGIGWGPTPQPMYPQPVYPDLSFDTISPGMPDVKPSAPPPDAAAAPLMPK